jgi:hypothetical protein
MRKIRSNRQNWRIELLIVYDMLVRDEAGVDQPDACDRLNGTRHQADRAAEYLMHLLFDAREGYRRVIGLERG